MYDKLYSVSSLFHNLLKNQLVINSLFFSKPKCFTVLSLSALEKCLIDIIHLTKLNKYYQPPSAQGRFFPYAFFKNMKTALKSFSPSDFGSPAPLITLFPILDSCEGQYSGHFWEEKKAWSREWEMLYIVL